MIVQSWYLSLIAFASFASDRVETILLVEDSIYSNGILISDRSNETLEEDCSNVSFLSKLEWEILDGKEGRLLESRSCSTKTYMIVVSFELVWKLLPLSEATRFPKYIKQARNNTRKEGYASCPKDWEIPEPVIKSGKTL